MRANTYSPVSRPQEFRLGGKVVSNRQTAWFGYCLCIALYAFVFSLWQIEPVPLNVQIIDTAVAALCIFPIALWKARGSREIPAFELICIAYLLAFASPLYLQKNQILIASQLEKFSWEEMNHTLELVFIGMLAFLTGYYLIFQSKVHVRALQIDLPMHPNKRHNFLKVALIVGLPLVVLSGINVINLSAGPLASFLTTFRNLVYVAIVLLSYRVMRGQENSLWKVVLYCAVALSALFGLATGMLEAAIVPLLLLVIVWWNVSRRVPIALLVGGLCFFVILNSVKMSYRSQTWAQKANVGVVDRFGVWVDLLEGNGGASGKGSSFEDTFRSSMSRFDLLHQFVRVQQLTPSTIPFYEGRSYGFLIYGWIPRFLWPDKPGAQDANDIFGVDYGLLTAEQTSSTMIGIGHLPEAYANYGVWGIAFIMALQGMFLAAVGKMLNGPYSEGGKAIYLSVMVFFLNGIGSATASLFMSIPLTIIISGIILRFFALGWRVIPSQR